MIRIFGYKEAGIYTELKTIYISIKIILSSNNVLYESKEIQRRYHG